MEDTAATQALKKSVEKPLAKMVTAVGCWEMATGFCFRSEWGSIIEVCQKEKLADSV
jgi:hypothetical protein